MHRLQLVDDGAELFDESCCTLSAVFMTGGFRLAGHGVPVAMSLACGRSLPSGFRSAPSCTGEKDLAIAVATVLGVPGKNVILIGAENERVGYASVAKAVASGKLYAVRISDAGRFYALALDFDGKGKMGPV